MGVLWLSTVPLTNGIIAGVFGVKHMSMLAGIVFFSHQVGSFLGVWLGGYLYSTQGSYDMVWGIAIALGVMSGLINLPINERPLVREQLRRHDENLAAARRHRHCAGAGVRGVSAAGLHGGSGEPGC
jgi:MFS family permease